MFFYSDLTTLNKPVFFIGLLYRSSIMFISVENFTSVDICSKEYLLRLFKGSQSVVHVISEASTFPYEPHLCLSSLARKQTIVASLSFCPTDSGPFQVPKLLGIGTVHWGRLLTSMPGKRGGKLDRGKGRWSERPLASVPLHGIVSQGSCIHAWTKHFLRNNHHCCPLSWINFGRCWPETSLFFSLPEWCPYCCFWNLHVIYASP